MKSKTCSALILCLLLWTSVNSEDEEEKARKYLEEVNLLYQEQAHESQLANWAYESNISEETKKKKLEVSAAFSKFDTEQKAKLNQFPWQTFQDENIRRQFDKFVALGNKLSDKKNERYDTLVADMKAIYSNATICSYKDPKKCDLALEPDITEIMATSTDEKELLHTWIEWRKQSGNKIRSMYPEYVALSNEAAALNNLEDASGFWLYPYHTEDIKEQIEKLWQQVRPFYLELHAYVRSKLREHYGENLITKKGPIPAHLLGNMWAQDWSNIANLTLPFPDVKKEDVTQNLINQKYTPLKMFQTADEFYQSINLTAMPETFWKNSIIEKPKDRQIVCHASAWDMCDTKDFRIKMCTDITAEDFYIIHHEMGHIEHFMQYTEQPFIFRHSANPGFHEAIGDLIALSVMTPAHLNKIGVLSKPTNTREEDLNYLFTKALEEIAFLPFGYLVDLWRWDVFAGVITEKTYNSGWWKFRTDYQGLKCPVEISEEDFDPGAKYHVAADVAYLEYFVASIVKFQFHEALCKIAGQYDPNNTAEKPLHNCDIYQSTDAGNLLKQMMAMGSSKPWPDAMELITGQRNMDAGPLLGYFDPIFQWLKEQNAKTGEFVGWEENEGAKV